MTSMFRAINDASARTVLLCAVPFVVTDGGPEECSATPVLRVCGDVGRSLRTHEGGVAALVRTEFRSWRYAGVLVRSSAMCLWVMSDEAVRIGASTFSMLSDPCVHIGFGNAVNELFPSRFFWGWVPLCRQEWAASVEVITPPDSSSLGGACCGGTQSHPTPDAACIVLGGTT
jgi:hypothetical protein